MSSSESKWTFGKKFYMDFNGTTSDLASRIDALQSSRDVPPTTLQSITSDLSLLTKSLTDATGGLPSYDQKQCELQLKALERSIEELRGTSASTTNFSFRRKATKPKLSASVVEPPANSGPTLIEPVKSSVTSSHRYLTTLDVCSSNSSGEVSISDLESCIVNLLPSDGDRTRITALHVRRVSKSVVLLPQIAGSIILHDLSACVIVVGCHQFRMHNSTVVDVYLESESDPIIEHCSGIKFAAYPGNPVPASSLLESKDFAVKDFSHILPTPSPNWSLLRKEGCEKSWPVSPLQDQALRDALAQLLPA